MSNNLVLAFRGRNPDVLTCIANLSNDEVFTPPELANRMLDMVAEAWAASHDGDNIWADKKVRFLDPFTKSGVFLREITKRLVDGLASQMPDLQRRVDHILTNQVYGIAITELTAMLARRSVYCTKWAAREHSICTKFESDAGNIWFQPSEHTWVGGSQTVETADEDGNPVTVVIDGRCSFCGASRVTLDRGEGLETHAYALIHTDDPLSVIRKAFGEDMQFDVIIGNPPYQLDDGGFGTSAAPIYQKFVERAKALEPRFLSMIIPSRWFAGGKGLDEFRESMLGDDRVRSIDDYLSASDVFAGVGLKGGVCYFLWNRDTPGLCRVTTHFKDWQDSSATRKLLENGADVFIRFNEGLSILKKVMAVETGQLDSLALPLERRLDNLVSANRPFGLRTFFKGRQSAEPCDLKVYRNGGIGYIGRNEIALGMPLIDSWKIFTGRAAPGTGNRDTYPHRILSTPFLGEPGSISSETYVCIGPFSSEEAAGNALSYLSCRLTRLLVLLHKSSQMTSRGVFTFVPTQDWSHPWTDDELYRKYAISDEEIAFIESVVRPMDLAEKDKDD